MNKSLSLIGAAAAVISLAACSSGTEHLYSVDAQSLSTEVAPGQDFYEYVNSTWMAENPLTADKARFGKFDVLGDSADARVRRIVTGLAATNPEPGTDAFRIATIYSQAMDSDRRNAEGAAPIMPILNKIEAAPADSMVDLFLWLQANYASPLLRAGIGADPKNSDIYAMEVSGGSMNMRDRDNYLKDDPRNTAQREAYKKLMLAQLALAGYDEAAAQRIMETVMNIDTQQAVDSRTKEERRDPNASYNPRAMAQIKADYPAFPWDRFFVETMGIATPDTVIVDDPKMLARANAQFASLSPRELKDYYIWKVVSGAAPYLSDAFSDAQFDYDRVVSGVEEQQPRWKRALGSTQRSLGQAIGRIYVEQYFPEESKARAREMVENLRTALGQHIDSLSWMSDATKEAAREKLAAFTVKIGYPDEWKDYSAMVIDPEASYFDNMHAVNMWRKADRNSRWGKPVDKTEWGMTPQTVNAYYSPSSNEICFPAGILQAPFFDAQASDAENYGGIGVVIGHEMTHGFDDQGAKFDAKGNMVNWWAPADSAMFAELTRRLAEQYSEVEVLPGLHANGLYTLGENIADHGGLRISMTAFQNAMKEKGIDPATYTVDGIPALQLFYINYANVWGQNIRDAEIERRTQTDVHSIGRLRTNVAIRNMAPFFEAFGITEGQPMFRPEEERVIIW